jgi:hypothetical protein
MLVGKLVPRRIEAEAEMAREAAQHLHIVGARRVGLGPGHDRALLDRQILVGNDELGIEIELLAKAVAGGAGPLRRVEGEEAGLDLLDGEARDGAGEFLGEDDAVGGDRGALQRPLPSGERVGRGEFLR